MILPCIFSHDLSADFEDALRVSVEAGAAGLELRGRMFGHSIGPIDDGDAARIREVCARYGARVAVIGSPVGKCSLDDPEELRQHQALFRRMAELAHVFETALIRGFALWRPGRDRSDDRARPDLEEHLPRV